MSARSVMLLDLFLTDQVNSSVRGTIQPCCTSISFKVQSSQDLILVGSCFQGEIPC